VARIDVLLDRVGTLPVLVGFNRRFDPSFAALKRRIDDGTIGRALLVRITSRDPAPPSLAYIRVSGGLFSDMSIHDLDMARFLLGEEPVSVFATASCLVDPAIGEAGDVDTAVIVLRTERGAICAIDNSRRASYGYDQRIEVLGETGMLACDNHTRTSLVAASALGVTREPALPFFLERYDSAYRNELDHFCDVVEGRARPAVTGADGRAALVLADACRECVRTHAEVSIARP
jgi:myo-inositol 2-dehydrogenase/D-chiro-inositol 1-dehydrogenase